MATYQRFEDLPVWQAAAELYGVCDDFLADAPPRLRSAFRNQLERAVLSVSNNIAEGFERGTTNELLSFLYIARGSAGEVRSMLIVLSRRPWAAAIKPQIANLIALAESCSRQLRAWADSLQNSDITGQRHLNDRTRANYEKREANKAGKGKLEALINQALPPDHPSRRKPSTMPPAPRTRGQAKLNTIINQALRPDSPARRDQSTTPPSKTPNNRSTEPRPPDEI
ncbi:four helix bundle protein [Verrucomicrobiota bacterium sgz303538]